MFQAKASVKASVATTWEWSKGIRWSNDNDDSDIGFKVIEDVCYATKEVETVDEKKSNKKNYKAPKGVRTRPEPYMYSGGKLDGVVREAYYKAQYEKANPES